jgi:hypothetical protein
VTVIPDYAAGDLDLLPRGELPVQSFEGEVTILPFYLIDIQLKKYGFKNVIAIPGKEMLLGRDILNNLTILLKGKNLTFKGPLGFMEHFA